MPKKYKNNCNFEKYGKFEIRPVFSCLVFPTQNSEKLNEIGIISIFLPDLSFQFTYSSMVRAFPPNASNYYKLLQ